MQTIPFSYPRRGLSGTFATFRLSKRAVTQYPPGTTVALVDSRSQRVLLHARVVSVDQGTLQQMAQQHAHQAHNWKEHPAAERAGLLMKSMMKRYPPGRVKDDSIVSVLYLEELPHDEGASP